MEKELLAYRTDDIETYIKDKGKENITIEELKNNKGETIFIARKKDKDSFDIVIETDPMPRERAIRVLKYAIDNSFRTKKSEQKSSVTKKIKIKLWGK